MFGSNFVKFMSILKQQVSSSSILVSFFIVMTHNSTLNLKLIHFLLWTKGSYESSNFDTFDFSGENFQNSSIQSISKQQVVFLQILYHSSMSWKIIPLYFFLAQTIYIFLKRSPLKWKFLRLGRAGVKFCQIPFANLETASRFL